MSRSVEKPMSGGNGSRSEVYAALPTGVVRTADGSKAHPYGQFTTDAILSLALYQLPEVYYTNAKSQLIRVIQSSGGDLVKQIVDETEQ